MPSCCFLHPIKGFCHPHDAMMSCTAAYTHYKAEQEVMPSILHRSAFKIRTVWMYDLRYWTNVFVSKKKTHSKCIDNPQHSVKTQLHGNQ